MAWGQGCELFLLQIQLYNTKHCCLWSSLNSWHLWNWMALISGSFCRILRVVALKKSNFPAIWRIEDVGFSCISWLLQLLCLRSCFENLTFGIKRWGDAATFRSFKYVSEIVWAICYTHMLYFLTNSRFTMVGEGFFAWTIYSKSRET